MINQDRLSRELYNNLKMFCKTNGIRLIDLYGPLRDLVLDLYAQPLPAIMLNDTESPVHKAVSIFHKEVVQNFIDFLNKNQNVYDKLLEEKDRVTKSWSDLGFVPDIRANFNIDRLEDSMQLGQWSPGSDSYLGFSVGNIDVDFSM